MKTLQLQRALYLAAPPVQAPAPAARRPQSAESVRRSRACRPGSRCARGLASQTHRRCILSRCTVSACLDCTKQARSWKQPDSLHGITSTCICGALRKVLEVLRVPREAVNQDQAASSTVAFAAGRPATEEQDNIARVAHSSDLAAGSLACLRADMRYCFDSCTEPCKPQISPGSPSRKPSCMSKRGAADEVVATCCASCAELRHSRRNA